MTRRPDWNIAIVDGQPEMVVNAAMVRELMKQSPLGEEVARRNLIAAGFPAHLLDDPKETTR